MHNGEAIERIIMKKDFVIPKIFFHNNSFNCFTIMHFDKNLFWSYHLNNVIQSSYATLRSLRQVQRFTPY